MAGLFDCLGSFVKHVFFPLFCIVFIAPLMYYYLISTSTDLRFEASPESLKFCAIFIVVWAIFSYLTIIIGLGLKQIFIGPKNIDGCVPDYTSNGNAFFVTVIAIAYYVGKFHPEIAIQITKLHPTCVVFYDVIGLIFSVYLCYIGHDFTIRKEDDEQERQMKEFYSKEREMEKKDSDIFAYNILFRFYRGMRFHPKVFGVDAKQLSNCRFGLGLWLFLPWMFYFYSLSIHKENNVLLYVNILLTLYLAKFYYWETGYFNTLDIILDRGGFYINWGCIVFVPTFYTSTNWVLANNYIDNPDKFELNIWLALGIFFLFMNYYTDYQKEKFQEYRGRVLDTTGADDNAKVVETLSRYGSTFYVKTKGGWKWLEEKKEGYRSKLLVGGLWGLGRKLNYTFELLFTYVWGFMGLYFSNFQPVFLVAGSYAIFLTILLIQRCYRDEKKCSTKYGNLWKVYSELTPYYLIFGLW